MRHPIWLGLLVLGSHSVFAQPQAATSPAKQPPTAAPTKTESEPTTKKYDAGSKDANASQTLVYIPHQHTVDSLAAMVSTLFSKADGVSVAVNHAGPSLLIRAPRSKRDEITRMLKQVDHPARDIGVRAYLLRSAKPLPKPQLTGKLVSVERTISQLHSNGTISTLDRMELVVSENSKGRFQIGRQVNVVVGQIAGPTGALNRYQTYAVGTLLQVNARFDGSGQIVAQVTFEQSRLKKPDAKAKPAAIGEFAPQELENVTQQSVVRIADGETQLLQHGQRGDEHVYLLFAAWKKKPSTSRDVVVRATSSDANPSTNRQTFSRNRGFGGAATGVPSRDLAKSLFSRYDRDKSGTLEAKELPASMLRQLDTNGDGKVTEKEIKERPPNRRLNGRTAPSRSRAAGQSGNTPATQERYLTYAKALIKRYDQDGDGLLDKNEQKKSPRQFRSADINGDGKVSAQEIASHLQAGAEN